MKKSRRSLHSYQLVSIAGEAKKINGTRLAGVYTEYFIIEPNTSGTNGIRYDIIGTDIVNNLKQVAFNTKGNFYNTAFACDPAVNFELLEDITITSSEDYTNQYPAGTGLGEIMSVRQRQGYEVRGISIDTYLSNARLEHVNVFFTFNIPPSTNKIHNLTIKYKLYDGKEYEVLIEGLTING